MALGAAIATTSRAAERVAERSVESSASAIEWAAIAGGALAAIGITIMLFTLASGVGLAAVRPWSFGSGLPSTFGVTTAIGLIVIQWLSSTVGGYLSGRLRIKWVGIRTDEIVFRDTAHGFLAWALATVVMGLLFSIVGSATVAAAAGAGAAAEPAAGNATTSFAIITSLSFFVGAFIASAAAALGGLHRDED